MIHISPPTDAFRLFLHSYRATHFTNGSFPTGLYTPYDFSASFPTRKNNKENKLKVKRKRKVWCFYIFLSPPAS